MNLFNCLFNRKQAKHNEPELGHIRVYRGLAYKIIVIEQKPHNGYFEQTNPRNYRSHGYISLEVHLTYPDGKGCWTTASQKDVQSTIEGFIKKAEKYIDHMIEEPIVRMDMEKAIRDALNK